MIKLRMIIYHILLFCFLSALFGGNSGRVDANPTIFTGPEGGNGTVTCSFNEFGKWKFFCRDKCKENDILIKTDEVSANYGRYRIRYKALRSGKSTLTVTITNLVQSDAGRYSFGLGSTSVPDSLQDFDVKVSDGLLNKSSDFVLTNAEGQDIESPCRDAASRSGMFFCRGKCKNQEDILIETDEDKAQNGRYGIEYKNGSVFGQYVTITKAVKSDSGEYTCGYGRVSSPDSSHSFLLLVDTPTTAQPNTTLQPFATSATPNNPTTTTTTTTATTTQSLLSSSGSSTPSPAFTKSMRQTSPAAPTTSAPITTQSLIFSSRGSASPSVFPKTSNQPTAAASTPNNPTTASQGLMSSSGSSTPSPAFTKSMRQTSPAAPTTSAPPTTQRFSSSSGSPTSSPVFPKTINQPEAAGLLSPTSSDAPSRVLPVAVSVPVVGVALLSGFLMYLRKIKKFLE